MTTDDKSVSDVDALAQEIRRVDGENKMGAGALAEAIMDFLSRRSPPSGYRLVPVEPTEAMIWAAHVEQTDPTPGRYCNANDRAFHIYRAMIEAAPPTVPSAQTEGWQLIETAPKDRTPILACFVPDMGRAQVVVEYDPDAEGDDYPWRAAESAAYHRKALTYWQPLPAAPSPKEGK